MLGSLQLKTPGNHNPEKRIGLPFGEPITQSKEKPGFHDFCKPGQIRRGRCAGFHWFGGGFSGLLLIAWDTAPGCFVYYRTQTEVLRNLPQSLSDKHALFSMLPEAFPLLNFLVRNMSISGMKYMFSPFSLSRCLSEWYFQFWITKVQMHLVWNETQALGASNPVLAAWSGQNTDVEQVEEHQNKTSRNNKVTNA